MRIERLSKIIVYFTLCAVLFGVKNMFSVHEPQIEFAALSDTGNLIRLWFTEHIDINNILCATLITVNAFFITRISLRFFHFLPKNYTPAIIYLCLICSYETYCNDTTSQLIVFLCLSSLERQLFLLYDKNSIKNSFESGFMLGMAVLIMPVTIFLYFIIFISQLSSGTFRLKEGTLSVIGTFMPLFFYSFALWITGGEFMLPINNSCEVITDSFMRKSINIYQYTIADMIYVAFISVEVIVGIVLFSIRMKNSIHKYVYTYYIFIWIIGVLILYATLFFSNIYNLVPLVFIPSTIIISILLLHIKRTYIKSILFAANIILPLSLNFLQKLI